MNAHDISPRTLNLLGRRGGDDGIITVDGRCDTAPKGRRETLVARGLCP